MSKMSSDSETNKPKRTTTKTPTKVDSPSSSEEEVVIKVKTSPKETKEVSEDSTPVSKAPALESAELPAEKKRDGPDYKTLWANAVELGLIPEEMKESKSFYRYIVNYTTLKEKMDEYEAVEESERAGQTAAFKTLFNEKRKENDQKYKEKKKTAKKSTKKNTKKDEEDSDEDKPRKPRSKSTHRKGRESSPSPEVRKSSKSTYKKGTQKKSTHKKGTHKKGAGEKEGSDKLMKLWNKCMEAGLIDEDYSFHRGIPDFITLGELKSLYSQYKDAKGKTRDLISSALNKDIKLFNSQSHPVSGFFRVFRTYEVLWKEAVKLDLINDSLDFNPDYAEWLDPKTLTAYMQTVVQNPKLIKPLAEIVAATIKTASKFVKKAAEHKKMDLKDLITEARKKGFLEKDTPCVDDRKCMSGVNEYDFRTAYFSFLKITDEDEAVRRKARWIAYMTYLSE
jgi:hypothetical protein